MRHMSWIVTAAVLTLVGCGSSTSPYGGGGSGSGGNGGGGGSGSTITVGNDFFNPTSVTVSAGSVTFRWATPSHGHTLTWDSGPGTLPANTGTITSGTRTVTLQPGTYQYHCSIHGGPGTGMHGTIVVQ
jgi:plastocyanin